MWVVDWIGDKIYAYSMNTKARDSAKDFTVRTASSNSPQDIWSDGTTMWMSDGLDNDKSIHAYNMRSKAYDSTKDFESSTLRAAGNWAPSGIWSDGTTMWVSDWIDDKIYAYNMSTKIRDRAKDFDTLSAAGNKDPRAIWSNGTTMWVLDRRNKRIYAYNMSSKKLVP